MNWGNKVVLAFGVFMAIIITMVVVSMRQSIFLVAPDYYDQEIKYQSQIDKMQATSDSNASIKIVNNQDKIELEFSVIPEKGEILFFRPSDATLDFTVAVLNEKVQSISKSKFSKGFWKMKISWKANGKEFYTEKTVII
ncbi:MAG: nitrogen fixation protein FixH [Cyclobacteriaceae bacterium]|jgi:nitrogen fixation protein FixH